jgi:hypothetical protein
MKKGFLKVLGNIKMYSSYYFAVASVIGAVWGAFAIYDNWRDENKILQDNVNTIIQTQKQQAKTDSILVEQQTEMKEQLNDIQSTTESLENSYVRYISRDASLTKEDFLEYMEGLSFDLKKNSSSALRPPMMNPEEMTASSK